MDWLHLSLPDPRAWERFWSTQELTPGHLGESWARSVASGVDADGPPSDPVLTQERLGLRQERHQRLLDGAHGGVVQRLIGRLKDPALLVTADGRIILAGTFCGWGRACLPCWA